MESKILGMPKWVFFTGIGLIIIGLIYYFYNKSKTAAAAAAAAAAPAAGTTAQVPVSTAGTAALVTAAALQTPPLNPAANTSGAVVNSNIIPVPAPSTTPQPIVMLPPGGITGSAAPPVSNVSSAIITPPNVGNTVVYTAPKAGGNTAVGMN